MRRVHTPVARRLVAQAHTIAARAQGTNAFSSPGAPTIRLRSRGYGPSHDLLRGIPDDATLCVEATLHPEDAAVQRAVLALSMPSLAEVHVTPVVPHDSYVSRVPQRSTAAVDGFQGDVLSSVERKVMEQCLQEQLADVANLVVEQVGQRTGQQLDALQVAHTDEMRNFAEIILHSVQDELRQLRLTRSTAERKKAAEDDARAEQHALPAMDVEAVAKVVSARVMEQLEGARLLSSAASSAHMKSAEAAVAELEQRTAAYFEQLQSYVQGIVDRDAAAVSAAAPAAVAELRTAVAEAIETASAAQQENLANLLNDWLADMQRNPPGSSSSSSGGNAPVDIKALEEMVESAVQASTDELRRIITGEVKKLGKSKGVASSSSRDGADDGADASGLLMEVEKVFDLVQATQSRLTAVDEVVGDVFKEQAATREALQTIQDLLQKQLSEVRTATAAAATTVPPATDDGDRAPSTTTTAKAMEEAVTSLQREVATASALATVQQEETQQQLLAVVQAVSDSVADAVQHHTAEAVQAALATVEAQLAALTTTAQTGADASARAAADAAAAAAAMTDLVFSSKKTAAQDDGAVANSAATTTPVEPFSREVLAEAVEAVLTPRWTALSTEVDKMNAANQLAIEQQLLHMANSVAASVTAGLQEQLEAARAAATADAAAAAAAAAQEQSKVVATAEEEEAAESERKTAAAVEAAAVSAATALAEKTTQELTHLREELMSTMQTEMRKSHEVDLTPMYKYIDSVLAFMKEELNVQETTLTAKMTSLADTVTTAVRESQAQQAASTQATGVATAATAATGADMSAKTAAQPTEDEKGTKAGTAATAAASPPLPPVTVEVPAALTNTLDLQTGALRHLEERLNELSHSQSRDMSTLLSRLQEATADFKAAATAAPPAPSGPPDPHPDQLAWQSGVSAQLTSLGESLEKRDADLLAAVRASAAVSDDVKAQLSQLEDTLKSASTAQRVELEAALQGIVAGSAQEQSRLVETLVRRVAEMQAALHDQAVAVQLLQPSPALTGLTPTQQQTQARLRTSTQEQLRRITAIVEEMTSGVAAKKRRAEADGTSTEAAAAELQTELRRLQELQAEEAALHSEVATAAAGPTATVESIVQTEVAKAQAALQASMREAVSHRDEAQKEILQTVQTVLDKVGDVGDHMSSIPSLADLQQLLDATLVRFAAEQKEAGAHVAQVVTEATRVSADEMKKAMQTTLSEGIAGLVEQRVFPAYHDKVEATLQSRLAAQATSVTAAVAGVAERTTAAVSTVEALIRDFNTRRADEVQQLLAGQQGQWLELHNTQVQTRIPLWWMLGNALLVCTVVLLSLYYVFVCLLLAFVPKPSEKTLGDATVSEDAATSAITSRAATGAMEVRAKERRGGRYVDQYM